MENKVNIKDLIDQEYNKMTDQQKNSLYDIFNDSLISKKLKDQVNKLIFVKQPPTPEEFLDPSQGYLPSDYIDGLYHHVKRDFIQAMRTENPYSIISIYGSIRCEAKNTEILMYDLSIKKIQDIKVNDLLMGDDSTPRKVLEITKGYGKLYKIKQNKADNYIVNENHKLVLQYTNSKKVIEVSVSEYQKFSKSKKQILKGIKTKLNFPEQEILIDPYYLGLFLGNDSNNCTEVITTDKKIIDFLYDYLEELKLRIKIAEKDQKTKFSLQKLLREYNLIQNKYIPKIYIQNSEKIRLQVLAGIIDSNSCCKDKRSNQYEIFQKSNKLTKDILLLARSLGFRTNSKKIIKKIKSINFEGEYNSIQISGDFSKVPIKIKRKKPGKNKTKVNVLRTGIQVEEHGEDKFFGFALDGNQRYLHSDLTITHNTGKSLLARLFTIYSIIYVSYLRDPHSYYKINKMSKICIYLVSFKSDKTKQVYLAPLLNILDASDMFIREHYERYVYTKKVDEHGRIHFSEASKFGDITFPNISIVTGKDAGSLVGADIVAGAISELTFFKEYVPGMTDEKIKKVFTKLFSRIQATVGFGNFPCWAYIDSSANDADSPVEKMILEDFKVNSKAFYQHYIVWKERPHLYPVYHKSGKTFDICTGDGTTPACIIDKNNRKDIPQDLVLPVPIDLYETFERELTDSIKDLAGHPTGKENRLIQSGKLIDNIFSNHCLKNIEGSIIADASDMPEGLLWGQLIDKFFSITKEKKFGIQRSPYEPRYLGLDLSFALKGDATGLCLLHKEWSREMQQILYIIDFAFAVIGKEKGINIDAPVHLVRDLKIHGNVMIKSAYTDSFQSESLKQQIERGGTTIIKKHSVDKTIDPYLYFYSCILNGIIKSGRNIFIKNNLKSLIKKRDTKGKEKIDHSDGKVIQDYFGNWDNSMAGFYAKDVSDAICQAVCCARDDDYVPITIYEDENKKYSIDKKDIESIIQETFKKIHTFS